MPLPSEDNLHRRLVESIVDYAIYMLEPDGTVASWNPGAERNKGYAPGEIIGKNFAIFFSSEDQADGAPQRSLRQAAADGRYEAEGWRYRKDGTRFWAQVVIDAVYEGRELVGFAKVTRDNTAIMEAQEKTRQALADAIAANEAKSNFLAIMSHEIRTPLNGVLGMAQAMAADDLSDTQRARLSVVVDSSRSLLAILNDILDLSKIEAGRIELENVDFDLDTVCRGAYAAFTNIANQKGVSFRLSSEQASGTYRGDPTRVRQILYNLLSNAIKFTHAGEVTALAERTGTGLRLTVSDTGIGMDEAALAKLYEPFRQADSSTTREFGGTGLGLSIVDQLVKLMGGHIQVRSQPGVGTEFIIDLATPYVGPPSETVSQPAGEEADQAIANEELRILAAEDNPTNQLVLRTLLNQVGLDPVVVSDGSAAVSAWRDGEWDLILMDIQMPTMDGIQATREIRRQEEEEGRRRTPIYALSANAMPHHVKEYLDRGMDGHVAKPIQVQELYQLLSSVS